MQAKMLSFKVPFSGFAAATFINCWASVYLYLEGIPLPEAQPHVCQEREGMPCNGCGNCRRTPVAIQERYFFLFDTLCGHSSLRLRFDGQPTEMQKWICEADLYDCGAEETIDFLFGYAGYDYTVVTDPAKFRAVIEASIGEDRPVIAKVEAGAGHFRVITGCMADELMGPDYAGVQEPPQRVPSYDELKALYIIGGKVEPRYTLKHGLERIKRVMEYNAREQLWSGYTEKMGLYTSDSLNQCSLEEKKARMKRVAETMWHTFNAHNFAEVFRGRYDEELRNPAFDEMCREIGGPCYGYTHDLAWALIALEEQADWSAYAARYYGEMIELTLSQIAENDQKVLAIVQKMLDMVR